MITITGWGAGLSCLDTSGSTYLALRRPAPLCGAANGLSNRRGYVLAGEYLQFGKQQSFDRPYLNLLVGLKCTCYTSFNGGATD